MAQTRVEPTPEEAAILNEERAKASQRQGKIAESTAANRAALATAADKADVLRVRHREERRSCLATATQEHNRIIGDGCGHIDALKLKIADSISDYLTAVFERKERIDSVKEAVLNELTHPTEGLPVPTLRASDDGVQIGGKAVSHIDWQREIRKTVAKSIQRFVPDHAPALEFGTEEI